jgi:hypothetical protein
LCITDVLRGRPTGYVYEQDRRIHEFR